jgi:predicted Zn finger-like uncharacterized protein
MLIVCPSCATSYDVELATLSPQGRQVRCLRCRTVWHAELSPADKLLAAAAAIAPDHDVAEQRTAALAAASIAQSGVSRAGDMTAESGPSELAARMPADDEHAAATAEQELAANAASSDPAGSSAEVEAPPIVPGDLDDGRPPIEVPAEDLAEHASAPVEDVESAAARRQRRPSRRRSIRWPLSQLQTGLLALALIDAVLIGWRSDIVRALPQTASFYGLLGLPVNLRGLTFDNVVTTTEQHEGVPILVIEGNIVNGARKVADVPRLKFIVRNAAHQEVYSWTAVPTRNVLPPGENVAFRARLVSPPPDARDLVLRFVNRRDIVAATR